MYTVVLLSLLAAPPLESRLFIAAGAKSEVEAKQALTGLKLPPQLLLGAGYPKVVRSDTVQGLKPGFVLVVLGACADVSAAEKGHNEGLAALVGRGLKGAYARAVEKQPSGACPLWLEASADPAVAKARERRDDPAALRAAAFALERDGDLLGAAILLRRALAFGATDEETVNLYRKVELLLEDLPDRLP